MRQILILFFMTLSIAVFCIPPTVSVASSDEEQQAIDLVTVANSLEQEPIFFLLQSHESHRLIWENQVMASEEKLSENENYVISLTTVGGLSFQTEADIRASQNLNGDNNNVTANTPEKFFSS